jgi:hypothetical protein
MIRIEGPKGDEVRGGRRKCAVRSAVITRFTKCYEVDEISGWGELEMQHASRGRCLQNYVLRTCRERPAGRPTRV